MFKLSILVLFLVTSLYSNERAVVRMQKQNTHRVALVMGNNNYTSEYLSRLHNPVNDAQAIKKVLESKNFEVIYAQDVTSRKMKQKLNLFYGKIRNGGVGFLYFSGHGMEFDGENYLIPIDAQINEKSEVSIDSIAVNSITKRMTRAKNRLNVVVLDACRNDPFAKGGSGGLAKIDPPAGTLVAYATSAGKTASDGKKGENGAFTKYLIKYMKQKDLSLTQVFKKTRTSVYRDTNHRQKPAVYDEIIGEEFFFTLQTKKIKPKPKPTPQSNINAESELWSMVKSSNTIEDYNYYITSYPKGRFVAVANYKIKKLKPKKVKPVKQRISTQVKPTIKPSSDKTWDKSIFRGKRSYSKNTKNTVKDNLMKVIWQKGRSSSEMSWSDAKGYCQNLSLDNYSDWRLPLYRELYYLADRTKYYPAIDKSHFNESSGWYWSSTEYKNDSSQAWFVDFGNGSDDYNFKSLKTYVRCVRGGQ